MNILGSAQPPYQVICVCGGYGFPLGTASAARITMIGKTLRAAGMGFYLLHCGPSPTGINTQRSGVYEGIPFQYTGSVKRPDNSLVRLLVYMSAVVGLTVRLVRLRHSRWNTLVYLYIMEGPINFYTGCLCRILGLAVVQELCEWFPGDPTCSVFTKWLHRRPIFKLATGALVISTAIEARVRERSAEANPHLLIHRIPAIVDFQRFATAAPMANHTDDAVPNFVYCGTWPKDVLFLVRALSLVKLSGYHCKLTIIGGCAEQSGSIVEYAMERGLSDGDIAFTGLVDERTLEACYKTATALLMPLWDDDRSITRLPNKIGEYLASARPVVGCKIGDLTNFLIDNVNAYLAEPGNERDFADRMIAVLRDPKRAEQIGLAGQQTCIAHLDYRAHLAALAKFFVGCIDYYNERCCI